MYRHIRCEVFRKAGVIKNFAKLTRKHLFWSLFFLIKVQAWNVIKMSLRHRGSPVNFVKFSRTLFFRTHPAAASDFSTMLVESLYCYPICLKIKRFCIYLWYYARLLFLNSWISIRFLKMLNPSERTVGYRKDFHKHVNNFFLVFSKFWNIFGFSSKKRFFSRKQGFQHVWDICKNKLEQTDTNINSNFWKSARYFYDYSKVLPFTKQALHQLVERNDMHMGISNSHF